MTPVTFLLMYSQSAVNPILYTCMSKQFRSSMKDFIKYIFRNKKTRNQQMAQFDLDR